MKVLSSREAVEKLQSWKRSHTSIKLIVTGNAEMAGMDVVAIDAVDEIHHIVSLAGNPRGYGFTLDAALITGDDDSLEITYPNIRYLLVRTVNN